LHRKAVFLLTRHTLFPALDEEKRDPGYQKKQDIIKNISAQRPEVKFSQNRPPIN